MKTDTTASPWCYDAAAGNAIQSGNLRHPTTLDDALQAAAFRLASGPITLTGAEVFRNRQRPSTRPIGAAPPHHDRLKSASCERRRLLAGRPDKQAPVAARAAAPRAMFRVDASH